ncbi:MAG: hypothetical protein ACK4F9_06800 [Brevinematia bacterium]
MLRELVYSIIDYFLKPKETIDKISSNPADVEKLGIIGATTTFLSIVLSYSKINIGILLGLSYVLLMVIYAIFIIGISVSIGKKPVIEIPKIFWFLFSIGIIDILTILTFPISIVIKPLFFITLLVIFTIKLYYLIVGISKLFEIPKSTAFFIIISPYIVIGIFIIFTLISSYTTVIEAIELIGL